MSTKISQDNGNFSKKFTVNFIIFINHFKPKYCEKCASFNSSLNYRATKIVANAIRMGDD